jgi:hypothetical protein
VQILRDVGGKRIPRIEIELDSGKSRGDNLSRPLGVGGGLGSGARVAIGVDPDTIPEAASKEVVDGGVQRTTDESAVSMPLMAVTVAPASEPSPERQRIINS